MLKNSSAGNSASRTSINFSSPQIAKQPFLQVVETGNSATFSVVVSNASGVAFQWKFNSADITGATGDSLLLANVGPADEGEYSVVVTNSAGSVTSAPAALLLDKDRDGLPNRWEIANFGDTTSQRSAGDPDRDGISNLDEFIDGTDPDSNASLRLRLTAYSDAGGSVTVTPMQLDYDLWEVITLTATPFPPNVFIGWAGDLNTGELNSTTNPATFALNGNKTVRARFAAAVPLPPGLVAFWRGEKDASDLIGGHDGAFFAGSSATAPSVTRWGKVGGAFDFDGTVHVRVPDSTALKPTQFTLEAWIFPTVLSGSHQAVIARGSSTNDDDSWWLGVFNGKPRFWSNHMGLGMAMLEAPSPIPLNQWTHLAISFDGAKRLYVNGAQIAWQGVLGGLVYDDAAVPVTIGSDWTANSSSYHFNGKVDEVAMYNRALTVNEVADLYNADFLGKNISQPYFTSPSRLSDVASGANYSQQLTTILGAPPVLFSLSAGVVPPGMTLSSTGVVSGISSVSGVFDFTVLATDALGIATEQLCVLRVLRPVVPPADLIAWWRGESATGSVAKDTIGTHDGSFFRGQAAAAPSYTKNGKVGGDFAFDGTLYVQVPDAPELRPSEMTAEAWIFPTAQGGNHHAVIARGSSTSDDDAWWMGVFNGKLRFWSGHLGSGAVMLEAPSAIPLNQWTHLAVSFDGTKRLYVNGALVASQGGLGALVYDPAAVPVIIGGDWARSAPVDLFNGQIDEVALYSRALSAAEVFSLADAGSAGKSLAGPYITSPSRLPPARVGNTYAQTFTSVLGTGPVGYALRTQSTLPPGLTLTPAGVLSGTPTDTGNFDFLVRATDTTGSFYELLCAVQVR